MHRSVPAFGPTVVAERNVRRQALDRLGDGRIGRFVATICRSLLLRTHPLPGPLLVLAVRKRVAVQPAQCLNRAHFSVERKVDAHLAHPVVPHPPPPHAHDLPAAQTLFLESTNKIVKNDIANSSFVQFEVWDFPGHVDTASAAVRPESRAARHVAPLAQRGRRSLGR